MTPNDRWNLKDDPDATRSMPGAPDSEDPRLLAAVKEYMGLLESGQRPSRQEFIRQHPEIADELSACLDGLAFVHSAAGQLQRTNAISSGAIHGEPEIDLATASPLGDFRLVREIGRGGMGVVYEAVQLSLGRRVALKVLPFAATLDERHLQRFRNEAQAAAQLHHTNIVPVYAVGCERSVHYYAMQLIEGQSLSDVIRALRKAAGRETDRLHRSPSAPPQMQRSETPPPGRSAPVVATSSPLLSQGIAHLRGSSTAEAASPSENLSVLRSEKRTSFFQTVARLGLQAAEALDYAHQQGVVHRDIKPENLMLDIRGNLWVTDFGLAQVYADGGLTRTGDLLGTLRYMSPEQASGRAVVLDQRTDVYSLGLTLYELLTLERALPGESREQLLMQIGSHEPRSPRLIDRAIPVELETILAKATAKEPADRYPTARALADDLNRFLHDEPILARPPSVWDKTVKWTRRHRSVALSALAMLLLTAVGLLISTVLIAREQGKTRDAYNRERAKAIEADQQRARALKSFTQARQAVDFFAGIAADEMNKPEFADVRKRMLEASLAYYQRFLNDREDDPTIEAELAAARSRVATILGELSAVDTFFRSLFRVRLLSEQSVQQDLKLTPDQIQALSISPGRTGGPDRDRGAGPGQRDPRQMTPEQNREWLSAKTIEIEHKLGAILSVAQLTRLRQIDRQLRGPLVFSDADVVEALSLTTAQQDRIHALQTQFRDNRFRRGPGNDRAEPGRVQEDTMKQIIALLTPSQDATWESLRGDPFTGTVFSHSFHPGPGGGGRRPEPRGGPR